MWKSAVNYYIDRRFYLSLILGGRVRDREQEVKEDGGGRDIH